MLQNIDLHSAESIENSVHDFTCLIRGVADPLFRKNSRVDNSNRPRNSHFKKSEWFDQACREAKLLFKNALYVYNCDKNDNNRSIMIEYKIAYKRLVKRKRRVYENSKIKEIERLRHSKPREFWKLFKKNKPNSNNNVSMDDFYNYFSSLQNDIPSAENHEASFFSNNHDFENINCRFEELDNPITSEEIKKSS